MLLDDVTVDFQLFDEALFWIRLQRLDANRCDLEEERLILGNNSGGYGCFGSSEATV